MELGRPRALPRLRGSPPRFCNGALSWSPPLDKTFARWTEMADDASSDGAVVMAHALTWHLQAPYVMVGGRLELSLGETSASALLERDGEEWTTLAGDLTGDVILDLDECFPHDSPATHAVRLRVVSESGFALYNMRVELTLQMAPLSLPALRLGANAVSYTDESQCRHVELTHTWCERDDLVAPIAPEPEAPSDGARETGTEPTLRWSDTCGSDGDYHEKCIHSEVPPLREPAMRDSHGVFRPTASRPVELQTNLYPQISTGYRLRDPARYGACRC